MYIYNIHTILMRTLIEPVADTNTVYDTEQFIVVIITMVIKLKSNLYLSTEIYGISNVL